MAATLVAIWFRIATALSEIVVGTVAQLIIGAFIGTGGLQGNTQWITCLAGTGAIVLTFLAGAELDPVIFKTKWRVALLVGAAGFIGPFLGCTLVGHYVLGWSMRSSWLRGVALSTTSVAVVYAVMLELGFNVTEYGKSILAAWAGSEAVLPAYMIGAVLAGTVGRDHMLVRRLRTLTFGLLTPFYFIRAGSFVSVPALIAAPATLLILFLAKMASKTAFVFPTVRAHQHVGHAGTYYTLMMSTGLTFGTISALFGLNHQVITQAQYSFLVGPVIASTVIPTLIANTFFLPRHLLPHKRASAAVPQIVDNPAAVREEA